MQTTFTTEQLRDPDVRESETILRKCVHCGFCTATCPTFVLLGDELDSPRGRIYLIKDMLENDRPATERVVKHVDRCLSCLSCMTTCPSGVNYMHLVDHARKHIEATYQPAGGGQMAPLDAGGGAAEPVALPACPDRRLARPAAGLPPARTAGRDDAACAPAAPLAVVRRPAADLSRGRPTPRPGGAALRLRPAGASPPDQ